MKGNWKFFNSSQPVKVVLSHASPELFNKSSFLFPSLQAFTYYSEDSEAK